MEASARIPVVFSTAMNALLRALLALPMQANTDTDCAMVMYSLIKGMDRL